jgi:hypothetical protein
VLVVQRSRQGVRSKEGHSWGHATCRLQYKQAQTCTPGAICSSRFADWSDTIKSVHPFHANPSATHNGGDTDGMSRTHRQLRTECCPYVLGGGTLRIAAKMLTATRQRILYRTEASHQPTCQLARVCLREHTCACACRRWGLHRLVLREWLDRHSHRSVCPSNMESGRQTRHEQFDQQDVECLTCGQGRQRSPFVESVLERSKLRKLRC